MREKKNSYLKGDTTSFLTTTTSTAESEKGKTGWIIFPLKKTDFCSAAHAEEMAFVIDIAKLTGSDFGEMGKREWRWDLGREQKQ